MVRGLNLIWKLEKLSRHNIAEMTLTSKKKKKKKKPHPNRFEIRTISRSIEELEHQNTEPLHIIQSYIDSL